MFSLRTGGRRARHHRHNFLDDGWWPEAASGHRARCRRRGFRDGAAVVARPLPAERPAVPACRPATAAPTVATAPAAVRLFACVGKGCCAKGGGPALIDALRREIARQGADGAIDVKACGCLDRCDEGPVVVAYGGAAAQAAKPPRGLAGVLAARPLRTFLRATPREAQAIVGAVLEHLTKENQHV